VIDYLFVARELARVGPFARPARARPDCAAARNDTRIAQQRDPLYTRNRWLM